MKDLDHERKPSLRISHIVYGRESRGRRVVYLLDPKVEGERKEIAEKVVLTRWRQRKFSGYAFSGDRLSPNLWRALSLVFGDDVFQWTKHSPAELQIIVEMKREELRRRKLSVPSANVLWALLQVCGPERLSKLIARHNNYIVVAQYGVPDLFLYAINNETGLPSIARFVEVKKPEERVSTDQRNEIAFLQALGLHARVLRLVERE